MGTPIALYKSGRQLNVKRSDFYKSTDRDVTSQVVVDDEIIAESSSERVTPTLFVNKLVATPLTISETHKTGDYYVRGINLKATKRGDGECRELR